MAGVKTGNHPLPGIENFIVQAIVHIELEAIEHHPGNIHFQPAVAYHQALRHRAGRGEQRAIVSLGRRLQSADIAIERRQSPQQNQRQAEKQQQLGE